MPDFLKIMYFCSFFILPFYFYIICLISSFLPYSFPCFSSPFYFSYPQFFIFYPKPKTIPCYFFRSIQQKYFHFSPHFSFFYILLFVSYFPLFPLFQLIICLFYPIFPYFAVFLLSFVFSFSSTFFIFHFMVLFFLFRYCLCILCYFTLILPLLYRIFPFVILFIVFILLFVSLSVFHLFC